MSRRAKKILQEALKLPREARASLAGSIIRSLDEGADDDAESAWDVEIARRVRDLESGRAKTVSWATLRRRILGRSKARG